MSDWGGLPGPRGVSDQGGLPGPWGVCLVLGGWYPSMH